MAVTNHILSGQDHVASGTPLCVIGTGYVGLTAGACLAYLGHDVICADASRERIAALSAGQVSIVESGLPELVREMVAAGRLHFTSDNVVAVTGAHFVFLCLPTPQDEDGSADLSRVINVAAQIGPALAPGSVVVNKSTVPVGTSRIVGDALSRPDVAIVSNPEFLAEGSAVRDFLHPDRIVVGSDVAEAAESVAALYGATGTHVLLTDAASAETIKYASNAYLAIRLAFVNSMAAVCEVSGADVRSVMAGMGADSRIGTAFLRPGPGWGGSCFPKDTAALVKTARDHGFEFDLLQAAVDANAQHRRWLVGRVVAAAGGDVVGKRIAVWGLTFKSGTDDLRDSPALEIAMELAALGATVQAYDPTVDNDLEHVSIALSPIAATEGASVLFIGTEWPLFRTQSLSDVARAMVSATIVDSRNILDPGAARRAGIRYQGLGFVDHGPDQVVAARLSRQRVRDSGSMESADPDPRYSSAWTP